MNEIYYDMFPELLKGSSAAQTRPMISFIGLYKEGNYLTNQIADFNIVKTTSLDYTQIAFDDTFQEVPANFPKSDLHSLLWGRWDYVNNEDVIQTTPSGVFTSQGHWYAHPSYSHAIFRNQVILNKHTKIFWATPYALDLDVQTQGVAMPVSISPLAGFLDFHHTQIIAIAALLENLIVFTESGMFLMFPQELGFGITEINKLRLRDKQSFIYEPLTQTLYFIDVKNMLYSYNKAGIKCLYYQHICLTIEKLDTCNGHVLLFGTNKLYSYKENFMTLIDNCAYYLAASHTLKLHNAISTPSINQIYISNLTFNNPRRKRLMTLYCSVQNDFSSRQNFYYSHKNKIVRLNKKGFMHVNRSDYIFDISLNYSSSAPLRLYEFRLSYQNDGTQGIRSSLVQCATRDPRNKE